MTDSLAFKCLQDAKLKHSNHQEEWLALNSTDGQIRPGLLSTTNMEYSYATTTYSLSSFPRFSQFPLYIAEHAESGI